MSEVIDISPGNLDSSLCFISPFICHEMMGLDAMILVFWMLSFNPAFSLSYFTFIKILFNSSSISATRVISSACLRLLIFLLAILIPTCDSSSPAFHMIYSAYKLNKQGDSVRLLDVLLSQFLCCSILSSNCCLDPHTGFSGDKPVLEYTIAF